MTVLADLTVVIPTVGRPVLARTLTALARQALRPAAVLIVDQSRAGATAAVREAAGAGLDGAAVIPSRGRGAAEARNRGFAAARTRFVAALDDDCVPEPDWAERLHAHLLAHPDEVITGQVRADTTGRSPSLVTTAVETCYAAPLRDRDPLYTGNMGLARVVFERVGPFDEHPALWWAAEDNDWAYRALRTGVPIRYVPDLVVTHLDWRPDEAHAAVRRRYARGQGGFYGRHLRSGDAFIAGRLVRDLTRGAWWYARGTTQRDAALRARGRAQLTDLPAGVVAGLRRARVGRPPHSRAATRLGQ